MKKKNVFALIAGILFLFVMIVNAVYYLVNSVTALTDFVNMITEDYEYLIYQSRVHFDAATSNLLLVLASLLFAIGTLKEKKKLINRGAVVSIINICYGIFTSLLEIIVLNGVVDGIDVSASLGNVIGGSLLTNILSIAMFILLMVLVKKSCEENGNPKVLMIVTSAFFALKLLITSGSCIIRSVNQLVEMMKFDSSVNNIMNILLTDSFGIILNLLSSGALILTCLWLGLKPKTPAAVEPVNPVSEENSPKE